MPHDSAGPPSEDVPAPNSRTRLSPERRSEIIDCAIEVFLEHGFSRTSTAEIAKRARTSKETLYKHFGTKEQLFALSVKETSARIRLPLELAFEGEPRQVLEEFGVAFVGAILAPQTIRCYRVIVAETSASRNELGRLFAESGPVPTLRVLAHYLAHMTELGRLRCDDPERAAVALSSLLVGQNLQLHLIGIARPMSAQRRREWVRFAIDVFMARYGPE